MFKSFSASSPSNVTVKNVAVFTVQFVAAGAIGALVGYYGVKAINRWGSTAASAVGSSAEQVVGG